MLCAEVQGCHEKCCQLRLMGDEVILLHNDNVLLQDVHQGTHTVLPEQKQSKTKTTVTLTVTEKLDKGT